MTMDHFSEYKAIQNEINAALETYFTADCPQKELLDAIQKENKENLDAYTPYVEQLCDSICSQYGISIY